MGVHDSLPGLVAAGSPGQDWEGVPAFVVNFRPHAGLLTPTREFVASFCGTFLRDPDTIFRITMAVHELLENAIKYSSDGTSHMRIEVRTEGGKSRISIRSENPATSQRITAVRDMIQQIHDAEDPFEFYCHLVRTSVERNTHSGLGLARIRAEAGLELASFVTGDHVAICAEAYIHDASIA
jgi:hypothetical protein